MLLPLLALILLPFLWAPMQTHQLESALFKREQSVIAIDNAGIVLGQNDRNLFNHIKSTNKLMDAMEVAHHSIHALAKVPVVGAAFIGEDQALEASIRAMHSAVYLMAQVSWAKGRLLVLKELSEFETELGKLDRSENIPIKTEHCKTCQLPIHWELSGNKVESGIAAQTAFPSPKVKVQMKGESLVRGSKWNYQVVMCEES